MIFLLDNTVLSNFALLGHLELLQLAFGDKLATAGQVLEEFDAGVIRGVLPESDLSWLLRLDLWPQEEPIYRAYLQRLNAGEAACLAIAVNRQGGIVTDDLDARKVAAQIRVPVSGTLGVLVRLVETGVLSLSTADELLEQMMSRGYHSPVDSIQPFL